MAIHQLQALLDHLCLNIVINLCQKFITITPNNFLQIVTSICQPSCVLPFIFWTYSLVSIFQNISCVLPFIFGHIHWSVSFKTTSSLLLRIESQTTLVLVIYLVFYKMSFTLCCKMHVVSCFNVMSFLSCDFTIINTYYHVKFSIGPHFWTCYYQIFLHLVQWYMVQNNGQKQNVFSHS